MSKTAKPRWRRPSSLLPVALVLLMGACETRGFHEGEVTPGPGRLTLSPAVFHGGEADRLVFQSRRETEEYVSWTGDGDSPGDESGPRTEAVFLEAGHGNVVVLALPYRQRTLEGQLKTWTALEGGIRDVGRARNLSVQGRTVSFRPFTHSPETGPENRSESRACAGFLSKWERRLLDHDRRPGKILFGYHCLAPGVVPEEGELERAVKAVRLSRTPRDDVAIGARFWDGGEGTRGNLAFPFKAGRSVTEFEPESD